MAIFNIIRSIYRWLTPRRYRALLAITFIIHIIVVLVFNTHSGVDGTIYQEQARDIIAADDFLACGALADAYWPPLFIIYLALFYVAFGDLAGLFFILNVIIALGTAIISAKYLGTVFGGRVSRWAALLYFNSAIIYMFTFYYKYELITGLLLSLSLYFLLTYRASIKISVISGFFLGLAALATGRILALVPALIYFIFTRKNVTIKGKKVICSIMFLAAIALAVAPWTIRNYLCFDKFIPISDNSGINFYTGFNPESDGSYMHPSQLPPPYNNWERRDNGAFYRAGVDFIINNPKEAAVLVLRKINLMWRIHYLDSALFYPFFYLGIFMLTTLIDSQKRSYARTIQLMMLFYTAFHCLFIARYYYLVPILPLVYGTALSSQKYLISYIEKRFR